MNKANLSVITLCEKNYNIPGNLFKYDAIINLI